MTTKEKLLEWCQRCTENYKGVEIKGFDKESWKDGLALNALLHIHRPESFIFDDLQFKSPVKRIEHALNIMKSDYFMALKISAEEFYLKADNNRIYMLVSELYEKLSSQESSSDESENNLNVESEFVIQRYQERVEELLAWILGAEEKLTQEQRQRGREESMDTIQEIFQSLDDFTTESRVKEKEIQDALQEGVMLVKSVLSKPEDLREIEIQRELLAVKWEELKNLIMDKQERLHNTLMALQKRQLKLFSDWLKTAEAQIASFAEIETDLQAVIKQLKVHMQFQNEVREHELHVNTLLNMVIIIDECENPNYSSENLTDDLHDQIEALGEKWKNVCRIVEEREATLNIWITLLKNEAEFTNWVAKTENRLQGIQNAVNDALKSSGSGTSYLGELLGRLKRMEDDENAKRREYFSIFLVLQKQLKTINQSSLAAIRIKEKIDSLSKQCQSITALRKLLSVKIQAMYDLQTQSKLERKGSMRASSLGHPSNKQLSTYKIDDWKKSVGEFMKSLLEHEETLGVRQNGGQPAGGQPARDLPLDDADLNKQEELIDELQFEFGEKELEYQGLVQQGNFLIGELQKLNRATDELEELIESMKPRWGQLKDALEDRQQKLDTHQRLVRLHGECNSLNRFLNQTNNRLENEKIIVKKLNSKQNYREINQVYEQWKLHKNPMQSQNKRVQAIEEEYQECVRQFAKLSTDQRALDVQHFLTCWQEMNRKIDEFKTEVEAMLKLGKLAKKKEEKLSEAYPKLVTAIDLLERWLIKTYQIVFVGQLNLFWGADEYEEQLRSFRGLEKDIQNEKGNLDYINETGNKVVQMHADAAWTPSFRSKVRDLNRRWTETIEIVANKIRHLERLRDLVPKLDKQIGEFEAWSETAQKFLAGSIEFGDFEMMDKQIEQYDALVADIDDEVLKRIGLINDHYKAIKEIIKSSDIQRLASSLSLNELPRADEEQQAANQTFKEELKEKVKEQIDSWNVIRDEAVSKRDLLKESLRECQKINEKVDEFDQEIEKIKCDRLMLSDIDSLKSHCSNLETINERLKKKLNSCFKMKDNLEKLNKKGKFETKICLEKMIDKITATERKCGDLIEEITTICSNGRTIQTKYDELCKMYTARAHWLDKLEAIISRSTQELVDSEEISDYIDNLENHLKNRPADVCLDRVEQIINDLNELFFDATGYVDQQEERWLSSTAEAGNRDKQLIQMLGETQELEQQLMIMQDKLKHIETNLGDHDEPLDVEHFEAKFKDASQMISFLEEQIDKLLAEQRHIAAKRFKEQLRFLQISYSELDRRFNELKSSASEMPDVNLEKDTLIDDLKKVYDDLASRQLTSLETQLIQQKLFEVTQPLPELQNRIQELQRSAHSLDHQQFSGPLEASEDQTKQSSKTSIPKSQSDLELAEELSKSSPSANLSGINGDCPPNSYSPNGYYDGERTPQAIEINLDNSEYLNEEELFEDSVDEPWERCVTNNYVPYYKNHDQKTTYWNHPNMMILMDDLTELNEIYYAAYRTSMKLRVIQKELFLNHIHITNMCKIFDTFDFANENLVQVPEMIAIFKRIYEDISAKVTPIVNFGLLIDMALNWVLNLYDLDRIGYVNALAFRASLVCMSRATIEEKYKVLFQLIADPKGKADRHAVGELLKHMLEIPKLLGDIAAFGGSNFEPSIRSCFETATQDKQQIDVKNFLCWLKKEPQSLVWLPLLHRLIIAEGSRHPLKCSVCRATPMIGFRYKCLKCFNTDLCQQCFLLRRPLAGHKNTHPIKEYCYVVGSGSGGDFSKIVRNKFKSSRKSFRKHFADSYLPVNGSGLDNMDSFEETKLGLNNNGVSLLQYSPLSANRDEVHNKMEFFANKLAEAELNETMSYTGGRSDHLADQLDAARNGSRQLTTAEFHLSKSNSDEHDLIMNYCNILNGTANSSVLSNKFASLNDSSSQVSRVSQASRGSQQTGSSCRRKMNGHLNSQDYLNDELDEHQLVKSYCSVLANRGQANQLKSPNQVLSELSLDNKRELAFLIQQLELENSALVHNFEELKKQKYGPLDTADIGSDRQLNSPNGRSSNGRSPNDQMNGGMKASISREEMLIEKIQLEQRSRHLEARMRLLSEQNEQLQSQLSRLKLFLENS